IAFEGRIVVIGFTSGAFPTVRANHVLIKNYAVLGLHWGNYRFFDPPSIPACQRELYRLYEEGKIRPLVSERVPMVDAPAALARGCRRDVRSGRSPSFHKPPPPASRRDSEDHPA